MHLRAATIIPRIFRIMNTYAVTACTCRRHDLRMTSLADGLAAVIFDFFGTLTPGIPAEVWLDHATQIAAVLGVDGRSVQDVLHESFPERATGALGDLPQTMQALADRLGVQLTSGQLDAACRVRRQVQRQLFALRGDALPTIASLRARGLKIGVLSDCTVELPESWPELPLSALVDAAVFSCTTGFRKPDPRLFEMVPARLGLRPRDCLYVGDGGGGELTAARAAGMRAILLAADDWASSAVYDREAEWNGDHISSLNDLSD
jgi:putative hydrolase of the HAD superfamily